MDDYGVDVAMDGDDEDEGDMEIDYEESATDNNLNTDEDQDRDDLAATVDDSAEVWTNDDGDESDLDDGNVEEDKEMMWQVNRFYAWLNPH